MCFSPLASFVTAGATGLVGLIALKKTDRPRELLLAATPIVFALQQTLEGLQWLNLPSAPGGPASSLPTVCFVLLAEVFWPVYAPLAVLLIEPDARRRPILLLCLAAGVGVAGYLLSRIIAQWPDAYLADDHIVYLVGNEHPIPVALGYLAATSLPLILSTLRSVFVLGAIIVAGSAIAYVAYWEAFVSVWCFFAAAASVVILGHFELARQSRLRASRA